MKTGQYLLTIPLIIITLSSKAEIILDGTLGRSGPLSGPEYQIKADLGQQRGSNLFHSFQTFNLENFESATFSGPSHLNNIISRVTGGHPSHINGLLRSSIQGADMYILNPYGILFGPDAKLDLSGSFHATTADTLRLQDGGEFNARHPSSSLLTVAPVEAFGFLTDTPAPLTLQNSELLVSKGENLSLIGGELRLEGSATLTNKHLIDKDIDKKDDELRFNTILEAEEGTINLASLGTSGQVLKTDTGLTLQGEGGKITAQHTAITSNSGDTMGHIVVRAGELELKNSAIILFGKSAKQESGMIDIVVSDLKLLESIIGAANESGIGPDILIKAEQNFSAESSLIASLPIEEEQKVIKGGKIDIETAQLNLSNQTLMISATTRGGQSGDIVLKVNKAFLQSSFLGNLSMSLAEDAGDAGKIEIAAEQMTLTDGATILNGTFGFGNTGMTTIKVSEQLTLSGVLDDQEDKLMPTGLVNLPPPNLLYEADILKDCTLCDLFSTESNLGKTGRLEIEAGNLTLREGAEISSATYGTEQGGDIDITVLDTLRILGHYVTEDNRIQNSSLNSRSSIPDVQAGDAGNISVQAGTIELSEGGEINTSTANAAGGDITLSLNQKLYLNKGEITTSVQGGSGNGGNISINKPQFIVLDQSQLIAQADAGRGGNIQIQSEQFIKSSDSLVNASSRLGLDGDIYIDSPSVNLDQFIVVLPDQFIKAELKKCDIEDLENPSTFKIIPKYLLQPFTIEAIRAWE